MGVLVGLVGDAGCGMRIGRCVRWCIGVCVCVYKVTCVPTRKGLYRELGVKMGQTPLFARSTITP